MALRKQGRSVRLLSAILPTGRSTVLSKTQKAIIVVGGWSLSVFSLPLLGILVWPSFPWCGAGADTTSKTFLSRQKKDVSTTDTTLAWGTRTQIAKMYRFLPRSLWERCDLEPQLRNTQQRAGKNKYNIYLQAHSAVVPISHRPTNHDACHHPRCCPFWNSLCLCPGTLWEGALY